MKPNAHIAAMAPYALADFAVPDGVKMVSLAQNESLRPPTPKAFDDSPFSVARGFDIIVPRSTMEIVFTTSHGSPGGNENINGQQLLAEIQAVIDGL